MPTFKGNYAEINPNLSDKQNLENIVNAYNELINSLSYTMNNLDDENMSNDFINTITSTREEE